MPKLELVSCMGAGYETVDAAAAKARGIVITNGRGAMMTASPITPWAC